MKKDILKTIAYIFLVFGASVLSFYISFKNLVVIEEGLPVASKGILDLSKYEFNDGRFVRVEGEAEFYWNQLLVPSNFKDSIKPKKSGFQNIHGIWNRFKIEDEKINGQGYGTYHLTIKVKRDGKYALKIKEFDCAYNLFVNEEAIIRNGHVGKSESTTIPSWKRQEVYFESVNKQIDLVLQIASFRHRKGGPEDVMLLGKANDIRNYKQEQVGLGYFLIGVFLIMLIYHFILYLYRTKDQSILYFCLFILVFIFRLLNLGEKLIYEITPGISWLFAIRLEYLSLTLAVPLFMLFIRSFFKSLISKRVVMTISWIAVIMSVFILFFPPKLFSYSILFYQVVIVFAAFYVLVALIKAMFKKLEHSFVLFGGYFFFFMIVANDIFYYNKVYDIPFVMPLGMFILILSQAFVLAYKTSKAFTDVERLSMQLDKQNRELESTVEIRTQEVTLQNKEIEKQKAELEAQAKKLIATNTKLVDLDKFKDGMTGMIVHDLKNPLNVILNLSKDEMVLYSANMMLNMVQNMLDIQKYEHTKMELIQEKCSIADAVEMAISQVNVLMQKKGVKLTNKMNSLIKFNFDESIIVRVIVNLLTNAVKFTQATGEISIGYEALENGFKLFVSDTGIGIAKDKRDQIFLKYGQIVTRRLDKSDSTGLGLAFCKLALEAHNGHIGFDSEEGKGATFWFILPCLNCKTISNINYDYGKLMSNDNLDIAIVQLKNLMKEDDFNYMLPYVNELKQFQIYEVSSLKGVLRKIDTNYSVPIFIWIKKLFEIIDGINEPAYFQLLSLFDKEK